MAIPVFDSSGAVAVGTSGNLSVNFPGTISAGDFLLLTFYQRDDATVATPTDFTLIGTATGSGSQRTYAWFKVADGTETGSVTIATTGGNVQMGIMHRYTGGNTIEGIGTLDNHDKTVSHPSITTTGTDRLAIAVTSINDNEEASIESFTGETGGDFTLDDDEFTTTGSDGHLSVQSAGMASSGTISGGSWTIDTPNDESWGTVGFALFFVTPAIPKVKAFRFYDDDGSPSESASTALAAQDTDITVDAAEADDVVHLRLRVDETNAGNGKTTDDWQLQSKLNAGSWQDVNGGSTNVRSADILGATPVLVDHTKQINTTKTATITLTKPSPVNTGDLLLLLVGTESTSPNQWTDNLTGWNVHLATQVNTESHAIFWRIADETEDTTIDVVAASSNGLMGYYLVISGVDTSDPFSGGFVDTDPTDASVHTFNEVTTDRGNCLGFYYANYGDDGTTFTVALDWIEKDEGTGAISGDIISSCFGTQSLTTAGASGDAVVTASVSVGAGGTLFAVQPDFTSGSALTDGAATTNRASAANWTLKDSTTLVRTAGSGDFDVTIPGGTPSEGDIVIVGVWSDNNLNGTTEGVTETGYTDIYLAAGSAPGFHLAYKIMGATPDTVVQVTPESAKDSPVIVQVWSGVDTANPIDATRTTDSGIDDGMPDAPSYTTITDDALVFAVGGLANIAEASVTVPSGYSNLSAQETSDGAPSDCTGMIASKQLATAGAENPAVFGGSGDDSWESVTFALRPDPGTGIGNPGSGSFVAGEQESKNGLIEDRQLTASNFTEHVFAIRLISANLVNTDTLDFRLRLNGADFTNDVVPGITIGATGGGSATIAATHTAAASLSLVLDAKRTLAASHAAAATLTQPATFRRTLAASASHVASLTQPKTIRQTLAATHSAAATLTQPKTIRRTLAAAHSAAATLSLELDLDLTLAAAHVSAPTLSTITARLESILATHTAAATLTPSLMRFQTISASHTAAASLAQPATFRRTIAASHTAAASLTAFERGFITLAASALHTATLTQPKTIRRTLAASHAAAATLAAIAGEDEQSVLATATHAASLTLIASFKRTLAASHAAAATLSQPATFRRSITAAHAAAATLSLLLDLKRTLAASHAGAATLSQPATFRRTLAASHSAAASLTAFERGFITIPATHAAAATLSTIAARLKSLNAAHTAAASLSDITARKISITASHSAAATLTAPATFRRTLAASHTAAATLTPLEKTVQSILATATHAASLSTIAARLISIIAAHSAAATLTAPPTFRRTLAASHTAAASLSAFEEGKVSILASHAAAATLTTIASFKRTLAAAHSSSASLTAFERDKITLAAAHTGAASLSTITARLITISASATHAATLSAVGGIAQDVLASATHAASLSTITSRLKALTAAHAAAASLTAPATFRRTLAAAHSASASLTAFERGFVTLSASHAAAATLTTDLTIRQSVLASHSATASLVFVVTRKRTLVATATHAPVLSRLGDFKRTLAASHAAAAALTAISGKEAILSANSLHAPTLLAIAKRVRTLAASASHAATLTLILSARRTLAASASHAASLTTEVTLRQSLLASAAHIATLVPIIRLGGGIFDLLGSRELTTELKGNRTGALFTELKGQREATTNLIGSVGND